MYGKTLWRFVKRHATTLFLLFVLPFVSAERDTALAATVEAGAGQNLTSRQDSLPDAIDLTVSGDVGVHAHDGGTVDITANVTITSRDAKGLFVENGSTVSLDGHIVVHEAGNFSRGVQVSDGSSAYISSGLSLSSDYVWGVYVYDSNSKAVIDGGIVIEEGAGSRVIGVYALNSGEITVNDGMRINHQGAIGALISGNGSKVTVNGNIVVNESRIESDRTTGVYAQSGGKATINGDINVTAKLAKAVHATNAGSEVIVDGDITVFNESAAPAQGILAEKGATVTITGDISHTGLWGGGLEISNAISAANEGTSVNIFGNVSTYGQSQTGIRAQDRAKVYVSGDVLHNSIYSDGINATGGAEVTVKGNVKVHNDSGGGVSAGDGGMVQVYGNIVLTQTSSIMAWAAAAEQGGTVNIYEGTVLAQGDTAIALRLDRGEFNLTNVTADAAEGAFLLYTDTYGNLIANSSQLTGDIRNVKRLNSAGEPNPAHTGPLNLTLSGDSSLSGAVRDVDQHSTTNITLSGAGDRWNVLGASIINGTLVNNGIVDLSLTPEAVLVLTRLEQNSSLDPGAGSSTFVIKPDEKNTANPRLLIGSMDDKPYMLSIANNGATDPTKHESFTLLEVQDRGAGGNFQWNKERDVEVGALRYIVEQLSKGNGFVVKLLRTEVLSNAAAASINSVSAAYLLNYAETYTLAQRLSDLRHGAGSPDLWFRLHGGKFESNPGNFVQDFDMSYGGVQVGLDRAIENNHGGSLRAGVMFGYSRSNLDHINGGSGTTESKLFGMYGTFSKQNGFYADAIIKYQSIENAFDVIDSEGVLVRGRGMNTGGFGTSLEIGQRLRLGKVGSNGWYIEPQAQISYMRQDGGYFTATNNLHIGVDAFTSLLGRVGLLVGYETDKTSLYAKVSRVREFGGDMDIYSNGSYLTQESFGSSWWVYGLGLTSKINDHNSVYLDIERASGGTFTQPWRLNAGWSIEF